MSDTITQTLRCEVVKPLEESWDDLGRRLRALSLPLHRVLNGVVTRVELAKAAEKAGETSVHPQTMAYRLARDLWKQERDAAAARVEKKKCYPGDAEVAAMKPGSSVVLGLAGQAFARWQKWNKERWKGTMVLPTFKSPSPIYVTTHGVSIIPQDGLSVLSLKLAEGRGATPTRLVIRPYGPSGFGAMRRILENPECVGDVRLCQERHDGKRKWQAFIAYTLAAPEKASGRTMALHRGMKNFLTVAVAGDEKREAYTTILETGEDIVKHKAVYRARRRSLGRQLRQIGGGAKGHGHDRRYELITRIESGESLWVRSKCQEVAAHAIRLAQRKGVGRILVEDWSNPAKEGAPELGEHLEMLVRSFPFAQLREMIAWAAKRAGLSVEFVSGEFNSRDCPGCGHRHETAQIGTFMCESCRLERNTDVIYAWNMIRRDGQPSPIEDAKRAAKRAKSRLIGGRKEQV